jgi:rhomboid family GlyGly-CTERM serine protease
MQSLQSTPSSVAQLGISAAERFALCAAALCLLLQLWPGAPAALEYRADRLLDEPWRALLGHFVHIGWGHALLNVVAWVLLARVFDRELGVARQCVAVILSAIGISVLLVLFEPGVAWYRGASGVLHGLFFAGCATWLRQGVRGPASQRLRATLLPLLLFAGGWIKLAFEQPLTATLPFSSWLGAATVPQAHLFGAMCGTVLGAVWIRSR